MVKKTKQGSKTETLSLRLDPKTRFILEFVARVRGQSITTVVERALKEASREVMMEHGVIPFDRPSMDWSFFWDPSEGIRTLNLLDDDRFPTTFDEDELRTFTRAHKEFFFIEYAKNPYADSGRPTPFRAYVDILWPSIEVFLSIWRETVSTDYWAAGRAMAEALQNAQVDAPLWPRPTKE